VKRVRVLVVLLAWGLCSAPAPTTLIATGQTSAPQRIISLVPALTEMLFAIGAGPQVIGVSSFDTFPPEVASRPRLGALLDPDVERVLAMQPDLVAIYGSQADLRQQLQRASIAVFDYRHGGLTAIMETMRALGDRTGHGREANALAAELERKLDAIRQRTAARPHPRTLLVFGRETGSLRNIYVSGGRGFLHDMLAVAGGVDLFADVDRESVQATTEAILTRAPEVIVELHEGPTMDPAAAAKAVAVWSRLASVPAIKARRVHILSGEGLVVPGPRVAASAERLARVLHPDAFTP
jgi:iron complex transport system substrate-binding protein